MAIDNTSLVKFGYGFDASTSKTSGMISFDASAQAIYVGDGSAANLVTSSVKDASFVESVLTITKIDGTVYKLDFSDVASATGVQMTFAGLGDRLDNLDSSVNTLNSSIGALAATVTLMDTSIRTDFADADASLAKRIKKLEDDDSVAGKVAKVGGAVENNVVIFAQGGEVKDLGVKIGEEALAVTADASTLATEKAVKDALKTVADNAVVGVNADATNLIYTITQGEATVGIINIPKDMVVESGSVERNPEGKDEGTYIKLVLKNVDEPLYINVSDLIEYVTSGSDVGDMVVINVSADHKVTATITDGTVTKAKLSSDVQTSLGKADTAIQSVTTGTNNGTIKVGETEVAVAGLESAAYKDASYFATPGDVSAAENAAKGYADDITVNGKSQSNQAITIGGADIIVGGDSSVHKDSTVAAAIAALDASVQAAINAAGVTSFTVDEDSSLYAETNSSTGTGAISFKIKIVDVSTAALDNNGLAEAYSVKYYVDKSVNDVKIAIEGNEGDDSTAATIAGAKAYADAQIAANALKWTVLQ